MARTAAIQGTLYAVHFAFPVIIMAYFLFSMALAHSSQEKDKPPGHTKSRRWILSLQTTILLLHTTETGLLLGDTLLFDGHLSSYDSNMYGLLSISIWILLLAEVKDGGSNISWRPIWGCWFLSAVSEIILLSLSIPLVEAKPLEIARIALSALRLLMLALLMLFLFHQTHGTLLGGDEEHAPLIPAKGGLKVRQQSSNYGSIRRLSMSYRKQSKYDEDETTLKHDERSKEPVFLCAHWLEYFETCRTLLQLFGPMEHRGVQHYLGLAFLLIIHRVFSLFLLIQYGRLVDSVLLTSQGQASSVASEMSLFVLCLLFARPGLLYQLEWFYGSYLEARIEKKVKVAVLIKLMELSRDFQTEKRTTDTGVLIAQARTTVRHLRAFVFTVAPYALDIIIGCIYLSCVFGGYVFMTFLLTALLFLSVVKQRPKFVEETERPTSEVSEQEAVQSLTNWESVTYFHGQEKERTRVMNTFEDQARARIVSRKIEFQIGILQKIIIWGAITTAASIGSFQVVHHRQSLGAFVMLVWYLHRILGQTMGATTMETWHEVVSNAAMLLKLFSIQPSVADGPHLFKLHRGEIIFEHVAFSYEQDQSLLRDVSFKIGRGQHIAIVGPIGSGKTSILRLLFRYYDVTNGKIMIDGQDIRDVTLESFRRHVGVVPQEIAILDDTIMENVRVGRPGASDEDVIKACKLAAVHQMVETSSDGYGTLIGQSGTKLSSGQRQLLALARVLLKDSPIILYETTDAIDPSTKNGIRDLLKSLKTSRTVLTTGYGLTFAEDADTLLLLEDGHIIQQGCPKQLLEDDEKVQAYFQYQPERTTPPEKKRIIEAKTGSEHIEKPKGSHHKHVQERSTSSTSKPFSPDAPEFVPKQHQKAESSASQQLPHQQQQHPIDPNRLHDRDSSAHSRSHAHRTASTERVSKREHRPRTPHTDSTSTIPKSKVDNKTNGDTTKFDGTVENNVPTQPVPRLNRWQRRRLARSDPQSTDAEPGKAKSPRKISTGSPSKLRQALRHVSGPGQFPSGGLTESKDSTESRIPTPDAQPVTGRRRQRHLHIKKYRDQAAARNNANSEGAYPRSSYGTGSSSTLTTSALVASAAASIREEPETDDTPT